VTEQLAQLPHLLTAHLQLTLLALLVGVGVSVPLGIVATRVRRLEGPVMAAASVTQTIPGLALLAVMVPVLAAVGLKSIGFLPAFIGLVLYSMLPILRNTVTGLDSVDAALVEAARGVGMTPGQRLWRVELPLAMPVIVAGVRTSAVWTVGTATLSTPVGAPSLGNYIFSGLQTRNFVSVLFGCVAASALALVLDGLVRGFEAAIRRRRRRAAVLVLAAISGLYVYTGMTLAWESMGVEPHIVIGSKTFTEQYILSAILAQHIRARAGVETRTVSSLGSTVAFDALRNDQIDVYVDYSGTVWATIMKRDTVGLPREQVMRQVAEYLEQTAGIELVASLGFENAYALAMREADAARLGVRRIGDLAPLAAGLSIGGDYEFFGRREWQQVRRVYGLEFRQQRSMDPTLMYQAVAHGAVDVIGAFSTDGRIEAFDLRVLEDDRQAIPPYDAIVLVSARVRRQYPRVVEALRQLQGVIDAAEMRRLNREVDVEGHSPESVARSFVQRLSAKGLTAR
jgi:osmoprotectant transport system permease protein